MAHERRDAEHGTPANDRFLPPVLLALTLTTGLIDAGSYLGLGHVFTANMTGNVVLLGFGLAHAGGLPVLAPSISLLAFLVGASLGGRLGLGIVERHKRIVLIGVGAEITLLLLAALLATAGTIRIDSKDAYVIIALLALAMGLRNAIVRKLAIPDLTTTVLTLTLTGLASDTASQANRWAHSARRLLAVTAMLVGALVGGLLEKQSLSLPLLAAACIATASLGGYVWAGRKAAKLSI